MNNEVMPYDFKGNQVRTVMIDNEPCFVANDVAKAIGYKSKSSIKSVIRRHVKDKYKEVHELETPGGKQKMVVITEPALYQMATMSQLPNAYPFQNWIYESVLPSIRKHGAYVEENTLNNWLNDPDTMIKALTALKEERENNAKLKPKADYFDKQLDSKGKKFIYDKLKEVGILPTNERNEVKA